MITRLLQAIVIAGLLACVGCKTQTPMIKYRPGTYQMQAAAAAHWQAMADELCGRLAAKPGLAGQTAFVCPTADGATAFDLAYHNLVKVGLLAKGWKLAESEEQAQWKLGIQSQLVAHGQRGYLGNPTSIWSWFGYTMTHFFTGDATGMDWQTRKDLVVTSYVRQGDATTFGHAQVVFVPAGDAKLYYGANDVAEMRWASDSDWDAMIGLGLLP